jgi:hypothetical protein
MKKKTLFLGGLVSGVVSGIALGQTWKSLLKEGIKAGILAERRIREVTQQAMEDVEDIVAEAGQEVEERDKERNVSS